MQAAVSTLLSVAPKLTTDMGQSKMDEAVALLDSLSHPLASDDTTALMSLLPADGDDACGLNWTILHWVEASPDWPRWDLLNDMANAWVDILRIRLKNGGIEQPEPVTERARTWVTLARGGIEKLLGRG